MIEIKCTKEEQKGMLMSLQLSEDCLWNLTGYLEIDCPDNPNLCEECLLKNIKWEVIDESNLV